MRGVDPCATAMDIGSEPLLGNGLREGEDPTGLKLG